MKRVIKEGDRFNQLVAIKFSHNGYEGKIIYWLFLCDCGQMKVLPKNSVISHRTVSCGCQRVRNTISRSTKHGDANRGARERLNSIWVDMRKRCRNKKDERYGGRGISVCSEWEKDYMSFRRWALDNGYSDNLSIERIDNNGGYSPENCRWVTMAEQAKNKRNSRVIEFDGYRMCASSWAKKYNIPYKNFHARIQRGWSMERALGINVEIKG
jgi:hypothetical protein